MTTPIKALTIAAPVEDVFIADPKSSREDQPTERSADQTQHNRDKPGLRPFHAREYVVRDKRPADEPGNQSEE